MVADPWFTVVGLQEGHRTLKQQIQGLGPLTQRIKGGTILDVGCAEGLIAKYLIDVGGAVSADGLEAMAERVETARQLLPDYPARFYQCDLEFFDAWLGRNPDALLDRYDAVLLLSILQKMVRPDRLLDQLAAMSSRFVVLRLPAPVIDDARSNNVPLDVPAFLAERGFGLLSEGISGANEWLGIFERA